MTHPTNTQSLLPLKNRVPGKILIVEDELGQRLAYTKALQKCGFQVIAPKNIKEVRRQAQELGDELAVALLDMRLIEPEYEDPNNPGLTGADLGLEIRRERKRAGDLSSQQFVICSAWQKIEYYKSAVQLGVAAYLLKDELIGIAGLARLVSHIRALYLRWAIETDCLGSSQLLKEIALTSRNQEESIVRFCQEIIAPRLEESLGAPFVILLTDNKGTKCCAGNIDVPQGYSRGLDDIQVMTFVEFKGTEPFIVNAQDSFWWERLSQDLLLKLDGAAFIPLSIREIKLTIGIIKDKSQETQFTEDTKELGKVIVQFFNRTLIELIIKLLSEFSENSGEMKGLARLCSHVGQEQLQLIPKVKEGNMQALDELQSLAEDLRTTGNFLQSLNAEDPHSADREDVPLAGFIKTVVNNLGLKLDYQVEGDCTLFITREDLYIIISRLFQWFERRGTDTKGGKAQVTVWCSETIHTAQLIFEDQSWCLPQYVRDRLFAPFTQGRAFPSAKGPVPGKEREGEKDQPGRYLPLYLSGKLVEIRYKGKIEDKTDELKIEQDKQDINFGHRFVLTFPKQK